MTPDTISLLNQLFGSATQSASVAMCRWTGGQIRMSLDEVRELALEAVSEELGIGDELLTVVALHLDGEMGGQLLLTFDEDNGEQLARALLSREPNRDDPVWQELQRSALNETGNILACAYLNAITHLIDRDLVPSPPDFIQDYGVSILQQALMTQAMVSDKILICRTRFVRQDEELNWNVFFVPSQELLRELERVMHTLV